MADVIGKFLKYGAPSKSTKNIYRCYLNKYFKVLKIDDPDNYFDSDRNYKYDVKDFALSIRDEPPNTQKTKITCVKKFLTEYEIEFPSKFWNRIKSENHLRGNHTIVEEKIPNNSQLKLILQFGGTKERALFLLNATSGTRIDEILNLTFDDIDMENRMIRIRDEITKTRVKRITFFTEEAKETLDSWIKLRPKYLRNSFVKSKYVRDSFEKQGYKFKRVLIDKNENAWRWDVYKDGKKIPDEEFIKAENRIFPFGYHTALETWNRMIERAGHPYNERDTNPKLKNPRYKYHIHTLRKFWYRNLQNTEANINHINSMGAHESELNGTYAKFTPEDLKETYDKYCNCLSVFSDLDKVDKTIRPKLESQDTAISSLIRKNKEYESEIQKLQTYSTHSFDRIKYLERKMEDMVHAREQEQDSAEREAKLQKEYTEKYAKEHPEKHAKVLELVKALQDLGLKVA